MVKKWIENGALVTLATCLLSGVTFADDSTSTGNANGNAPVSGQSTTSTATTQKKAQPIPLSISDYSMIQGPSVKDPGSKLAADDAQGTLQPLSSRQYFSTAYLINDHMSIGPVLDFTENFNSAPTFGYTNGITWNDSFITFRDNGIVKTKLGGDNEFSGNLWLNYYAPISTSSQQNNLMGEFAVWFNPTYQFHGTRWSLSGYNFVKYFANTRETDVNSGTPLRRWTAYAGPQVNYEVSDALTIFVLYEANLRLYTNGQTDAQLNPARSDTDLEPGVMWSVSKNITLFPYFNWFLNQPVDTTSIGLNASFKFL